MTANAFRPSPRVDPLRAASRVRSWRVELLTRDEQSLGFIGDASTSATAAGVVSWEVSGNENSPIGLSGTLTVRGDVAAGGVPVDWSQHRIRIWEAIDGLGEWPLGVLIPALPSPSHDWRSTDWSVALTGKLQAFQQDRLTEPWAISKTTTVTGRIIWWLQQLGELKRYVTDTAQKLPAPVFWSAGVSKLTMLNELAGAIGHRGLRADPSGGVISAPYVLPQDRPVDWEFAADEVSLLAPKWDEEWNLAEVPNVFLARSAEVDGVSWQAVAEDWNTDRPTSIPRRGGLRVVEVEEGIEAASKAALQTRADRRLAELVAPSQRIQVSHLSVPTVPLDGRPGLWFGDVVTHTRPGHTHTAVVEQMSWSSASPMCSATWRRI